MKKLIIWLIVIGLLVAGYIGVLRGRSVFEEPGKIDVVAAGSVVIPVSASCEAQARRRVEIKSKASGNVIELLAEEGQYVDEGDLLIRLDKQEEQRNVQQRQADVDRFRAMVEEARTNHKLAQRDVPLNIKKAEAKLKAARATLKTTEFDYNRIKALYDQGKETDLALTRAESAYYEAQANVSGMEADLDRANSGDLDVEAALNRLHQSEASLSAAEENLKDAERRLSETDIFSPIRGLVVKRHISIGAIVSSATTTFTGGTVLMELADMSELIVEAKVDESDIDRVSAMMHDGQNLGPPAPDRPLPATPERPDEVTITFEGLRGRSFLGRIIEIAQEPEDRANIITYNVRILLYPEQDLTRVRLGMQGTVEFRPAQEEGLVVPYQAVFRRTDDSFYVLVPEKRGNLEEPVERNVEVGLSDGVQVIIRTGLELGERYYVKKPLRIPRRTKEDSGSAT